MKTAMRMLVCLVMAATSTAVFASGEEAATDTATDARPVQAGDEYAYRQMNTIEQDAAGGGRGEPSSALDRKQDDRRAQKAESVDEYNHRRFLEEVWTLP